MGLLKRSSTVAAGGKQKRELGTRDDQIFFETKEICKSWIFEVVFFGVSKVIETVVVFVIVAAVVAGLFHETIETLVVLTIA